MSFLLTALLVVLIIGIFAALMREGLWTNAIALVNVTTAALLATNFFEPIAEWLTEQVPRGAYFWDFLTLWVLFIVIYAVLRAATDAVSKFRVRFFKPVDVAGGGLFALWVAWVFTCFVMMTLHTAPLSRNFLFEGFKPEERMFFGLAPDRQWLAFTHRVSKQGYRRRTVQPFDARAEFMPKYASMRERYSQDPSVFAEVGP